MSATNDAARLRAATERRRLAEAMRLQEIEGNPFDARDVALFETFEREGWPNARRRAYIIAEATGEPLPIRVPAATE